MVNFAIAHLFGRHIGGRADNHAFHRIVCQALLKFGVFGQLCQTEIENLHETVGTQHYIFRLDVAVNDSGFVRRRQSLAGLRDNGKRLFEINAANDQISDGFAFDVFGGDIVNAVRASDIVNRHDIRMIQSGNHLRFTSETLDSFGIGDEFGGQNFQRDFPV